MERNEIEKYYYFPEDDYPEFDPEIRLHLLGGEFMIGYLDHCHWLDPNEEPNRIDCITFIEYPEWEDSGEINETMWLVRRERIICMEWVHDPPIIN